ncbi:MAG TPA: response regulator [Dehalococcoidales bacterium]|nr:response regulator [Dehalococcoidales bacterium]
MKNSITHARKILVVEDEPAICDVCYRVLSREGFEVDIAVNGKLAQDMIEKKQYDFCLIDIRIPAMNGEGLYQWLQESHPTLADRVMFTTGDVMDGDTRSFLEQTARPFLLKPFTPSEVKAMAREASKEIEKWRQNK